MQNEHLTKTNKYNFKTLKLRQELPSLNCYSFFLANDNALASLTSTNFNNLQF